jgi:PKD repeat protein
MNHNTQRILRQAVLETLEERRLMSSVTFADGVLTLTGDAHSDNKLSVTLNGPGNRVFGQVGHSARSVLLSRVREIRVIGGEGNDTVTIDPRLLKGAFIDTRGGNDTINGGGGSDTILAGNGDDLIDGRGGGDLIRGQAGNDTIVGGGGFDTIYGESGADTVINVGVNDLVFPDEADPKPEPAPQPEPEPQPEPTKPEPQAPTPKPAETPVPQTPPPAAQTPTADADRPSPVIKLIGGDSVAGSTVHVNALESLLKNGDALDATYHWNFGDAGSKYNELQGWNAAHVYSKPGTYTITLTVTDSAGKTATATTTVNISPDTRHTIYVDAQGSDSNDGLTPMTAVKTFAKAMSMLTSDTRILFESGDVFDVKHGVQFNGNNIYLGAYGTGDKPVIRWVGTEQWASIFSTNYGNNIRIDGLTFTSAANVERPTAIRPGHATNYTVTNSLFLRVNEVINANGKPNGLLVQDNSVPKNGGVASTFIWAEGNDLVILGNDVHTPGQYTIRANDYERINISYNNFSNFNRANLNMQRGSYVWVNSNSFAGRSIGFSPLAGDSGYGDAKWQTARTEFVRVENNYLDFMYPKTQGHIEVKAGAEHVLIRNNVIHTTEHAFSLTGSEAGYPDRRLWDLRIIGNTVINEGQFGSFLRLWPSATTGQITVKNNLYYAPNQTTGAYDSSLMSIHSKSMSAFKEISNNIWYQVKSDSYAGPQGYFYVKPSDGSTGFLTPDKWDAFEMVHGDVFAKVTLGATHQVTVSGVTAGSTLSRAA